MCFRRRREEAIRREVEAPARLGPDNVRLLERVGDRGDRHFLARRLRKRLHDRVERHLHAAGHLELQTLLDNIRRAGLAALATDADEVVVAVAEVLRVECNVGHRPGLDSFAGTLDDTPSLLLGIEPFLDGVLVGTGKGGEDEAPGVGVPGGNTHLVDTAHDRHNLGEVREVEIR